MSEKNASRQDAKLAKKNPIFKLEQKDIRQASFVPWRAWRLGESNIIV